MPRARAGPLVAGALVAAAAVGHLLTLRCGRPDNGDFFRYMKFFTVQPVGLALFPSADDPQWGDRYAHYWLPRWRVAAPGERQIPARDSGSTLLLWAPGVALSRLLVSREEFDSRWLGLLPRLFILGGLGFLAWRAAARPAAKPRGIELLAVLPLAWAVTDPWLSSYFNSFYRESGAVVFALLALAALVATESGTRGPLFAFALLSALLALSAPAHGALGALGAGVVWATPAALSRRGRGALAAIPLLAGALSAMLVMPEMRHNNAYQSLFDGILADSRAPAGHLERLGLPASAGERIGTIAFTPESQSFIAAYGSRITHAATAAVALREPAAAARLFLRGLAGLHQTAAPLERLHAKGETPSPVERWLNGWGRLKQGLRPRGPTFLVLAAAAAVGGAAAAWRAPRSRAHALGRALVFVVLAALAEVAVSVFGDGVSDLAKHLVPANFFVDLAIVCAVWLAILSLQGVRPTRRIKSA